MHRTRDEILAARRRLREQYGDLFDSIAALLFRIDPIGINVGKNRGEYESEAETILPRLQRCESAEDVLRVVHEEFVGWFGAETAGSKERYAEIASGIYRLTQKKKRV